MGQVDRRSAVLRARRTSCLGSLRFVDDTVRQTTLLILPNRNTTTRLHVHGAALDSPQGASDDWFKMTIDPALTPTLNLTAEGRYPMTFSYKFHQACAGEGGCAT